MHTVYYYNIGIYGQTVFLGVKGGLHNIGVPKERSERCISPANFEK